MVQLRPAAWLPVTFRSGAMKPQYLLCKYHWVVYADRCLWELSGEIISGEIVFFK